MSAPRLAGGVAVAVLLGTRLAGAAPAGDIRDIRGPLPIAAPTPWTLYLALAVGALVLAAVTVLIVRRVRARRRTADQVALARLAAAARLVGEGGRADVFAEAVSDALRAYIEARFEIRAAHATSEEFLADLVARAPGLPALAPHRDELAAFLGHCDVAKFAGRDLGEELRRELLASAVRLVERTHEALRSEKRSRPRWRWPRARAAEGAAR